MNENLDSNLIVTLDSIYSEKKIYVKDLVILFRCIYDYSLIQGRKLNKNKVKNIFLDLDLFLSLTPIEYCEKILEVIGLKNDKRLNSYIESKKYGVVAEKRSGTSKTKMKYYFLETIYDLIKDLIELLIDNYFDGKSFFNESVNMLEFNGSDDFEDEDVENKKNNCFDYLEEWKKYEYLDDLIIIDYTDDYIIVNLVIT